MPPPRQRQQSSHCPLPPDHYPLSCAGARIHRIRIDRRAQRSGSVERGRVDLGPAFGRRLAHEGGAAQVADLVDRRAGREPVRDLADLPLGVAVHEQVRLGVEQQRAAHLLRPVVEVRDATQRCLDAADDHRHVLVGLADALRIHDHAAVGSRARDAVRRVGVVTADAAIRGVAVHHRIHVAAGHAEEQVRAAELHEVARRVPVRLRDDPDAEALRLEQSADDGHAEARVVHVGVAGDDDDVARIPAELVHLRPRHGQERRRAEAVGPVLAVGEEVAGRLHGAQFRPARAPACVATAAVDFLRSRHKSGWRGSRRRDHPAD